MKGWFRQKQPPEDKSVLTDEQILLLLVPRVTIEHNVVPPLLREQRKLQEQVKRQAIDVQDEMEISDILTKFA